jgi:hypothetical protein
MKRLLLAAAVLLFGPAAFADSWTINFEQYAAYTQISNQYAAEGVVFTNALQLTAPYYDYFDYPPHSGSGVITNDPGASITASFTGPALIYNVSGWYTDADGITVRAYSAGNVLLETVNGAGVIGSSSEFVLSSGTAIAYITITDDDGNSDSETIDDLSFSTPEPGTLVLMGTGILALAWFMRRRFARTAPAVPCV